MNGAIIEAKLKEDACTDSVKHFTLFIDNYVINDVIWDSDEDTFLFNDTVSCGGKMIIPAINNIRTKCILKDLLWKALDKEEPILYVGAAWTKSVKIVRDGIIVELRAGSFDMSFFFKNFNRDDIHSLKHAMVGDLDSLKELFAVLLRNLDEEVKEIMSQVDNVVTTNENVYTFRCAVFADVEKELRAILREGYSIKSQSICFDGEAYCVSVVMIKLRSCEASDNMNLF